MAQPIAWRRLLAEAAAVVASILLAFAIDAAWDTHQQDVEVREILTGLREEAVVNQEAIAEAGAGTLKAIHRLERFRSGTLEEYKAVSPSDFYEEVYLPFVRGWTATFQVGFLNATISSGKLALIEDPTTRAALAGLSAYIESLVRLENELDRIGAEAAATIGQYPRVRQVSGSVETDSAGMMELRGDRTLQGLASARIIFFGGYWYTLDNALRPRIAEVIRLLDKDLQALR